MLSYPDILLFRKMYVGALHMHTTEKSLTDYFSQFGDVQHCQVRSTPEVFKTRLG